MGFFFGIKLVLLPGRGEDPPFLTAAVVPVPLGKAVLAGGSFLQGTVGSGECKTWGRVWGFVAGERGRERHCFQLLAGPHPLFSFPSDLGVCYGDHLYMII